MLMLENKKGSLTKIKKSGIAMEMPFNHLIRDNIEFLMTS